MAKLLFDRRMLVVEDEMLVLMNEEDMLADLGCESVTAAATVEDALALIDTQFFDAAMLDMNLGGTRTHAVAASLAAHGVPFLFATGYVGEDSGGEYRDRPMLRKPFLFSQLERMLTDMLVPA